MRLDHLFDPRILLIFVSSFVGGGAAYFAGFPMPFLIGGIFGAACFVLLYERKGKQLPKMTRWVRLCAAAVIGTMIGSRFSPELLALLPQFWISGIFVVLFIFVAQGGNYLVMRHLGGYKKVDAYFAALPGGIVDAIALAEQAKADLRIVTSQHFIRIIFVVVGVPVLFWVVKGNAVGSSAGESFAAATYDFADILLVFVVATSGLFLGRAVRLPVAHMIGPLLLALALSVGGFITIDMPSWLQHLAQYFMGASLGAQFSGISRRMLVKGLGIGLLSGGFMLALAGIIAFILADLVPASFEALFISFAAGGLAEMSLIALTLNFNPVVVALHHLARLFLTIWIGNLLAVRLFKLVPKS